MTKNIEELFERQIDWKEEVPGGIQFFSYVEGELCQLTMNDYPDEPMYTLKWKDSTLDMDDLPDGWTIPEME